MEFMELKVCLHCKACENTVRKALWKIQGIRCVQIERTKNKISVLGHIRHKDVLKAIRRTARQATLLRSTTAFSHPPLMSNFFCGVTRTLKFNFKRQGEGDTSSTKRLKIARKSHVIEHLSFVGCRSC